MPANPSDAACADFVDHSHIKLQGFLRQRWYYPFITNGPARDPESCRHCKSDRQPSASPEQCPVDAAVILCSN